MGKRARDPAELAIAGAWMIVGALTVLGAVLVAYMGGRSVPFWDQWRYVDPGVYLHNLLALHNHQHPILLDRVLFAIDYYLFDARAWFLQCATLVILALEAAGFVLLARLGGVRGRIATLAMSGFVLAMVFNPNMDDNLTWGFQPTFVANFASAVGAAFALASYAVAPRRWKLALSLLCAIVAVTNLANGVFVPVLLALMALHLKLPRHVVLLHGAITLLAYPIFFAPGVERARLTQAPDIVTWFLTYLGSPLAHPLQSLWGDLNPAPWAFWIGLFVFLGAIAFIFQTARTRFRDPVALALVMLIVFILATAGLTAIGRGYSGIRTALAGRYICASSVLIIALMIGATLELSRRDISVRLRQSLLAVGAVVIVLIPLSTVHVLHDIAPRYRASIVAQTALVIGARTEPNIRPVSIFGRVDEVWAGSEILRAAHKWHFRDRWSHAMGERLPRDPRVPACGGGAIRPYQQARTAALGFVRVRGWVTNGPARRNRIVVIAHPDGEIVGYGLVHKDASDLWGGHLFGPEQRTWSGHARMPPGAERERLVAYLANESDIQCRVGAGAIRLGPNRPQR